MALVAPASAAPVAGLARTSYFISYGQPTLVRSVPCYVTDDHEDQTWEGSLAAGATLRLAWDWCSPEDVGNVPWEGSIEFVAVALTGRGTFDLSLADDGNRLAPHLLPYRNGYEYWQRCSSPYLRAAHGMTTLVITNTGSRLARDVAIQIAVSTAHSTSMGAWCPVRSDWGF